MSYKVTSRTAIARKRWSALSEQERIAFLQANGLATSWAERGWQQLRKDIQILFEECKELA